MLASIFASKVHQSFRMPYRLLILAFCFFAVSYRQAGAQVPTPAIGARSHAGRRLLPRGL